MSAFAELIAEAEGLGVTKLSWECDVRGWRKDPQRVSRWSCRATNSTDPAETYAGLGRTGEEALRAVVAFLKALQS